MAEQTGIEWADATWNPWYGCHKVSAGCKNCYMFRDMKRYGRDPNVVQRASERTFRAPVRWFKTLRPGSRIFTCSWSDWFIEEADEWRPYAWSLIEELPMFNFLILTKRPERIADHLPHGWGLGWRNVWLGVSAENQEMADKRIPVLMNTPARVRFVSAEPLLGPINFERIQFGWQHTQGAKEPYAFNAFQDRLIFTDEGDVEVGRIHWIITGGESDGAAPRPCDLDWVRSIRDQCSRSSAAFFHKQHGGSRKIDGAWGGRALDGAVHSGFPK